MITKELQATLNLAIKEAVTRRHEYLTLEHLLLAILRDPTGSKVIRNCGGDIESLKNELERFLAGKMEQLPEGGEQPPEYTPAFHRVLERAALQ
ncbi:MAG: Clp protease N-terminal domain-containing protein, partial [Blastocatellia bacterium]